MLTKKQGIALLGVVAIIIITTVVVGRGLAKKQQEIFAPNSENKNFLQEYSLQEIEKTAEEPVTEPTFPEEDAASAPPAEPASLE